WANPPGDAKPKNALRICFGRAFLGFYCRIAGIDVARRLSYSTFAVSHVAKRGGLLFETDKELQGLLT
ncbi:MAG: hypothetical protein OQK97_00835, partial [Deltaproteobacteria bacterium]|nr:hypothetical protein [Deltaproteobacteria bacterium]